MGKALSLGCPGGIGGGLHLDEQVGHGRRPLGLVRDDCDRGEIADEMRIMEYWYEPIFDCVNRYWRSRAASV